MADLANLNSDHKICKLVEDLPGFMHFDVTVGHIFDMMMGDANSYIETLDMDWLTLVYRIHHREVIHWCELPYAELIDEDYAQQAVNFVMAATLAWCTKFCEVYAESGDNAVLSEKVGNCKVFYLDRYKVRLH